MVVLQADKRMTPKQLKALEKELSEKLGEKVVILPAGFTIISKSDCNG